MQFGWQRLHQLILRHTNRPVVIAQCVFSHHFIFTLAQQEADSRAVLWVLYLGIHRRKIEAQFAQMLGLELASLEFDHHIATQLQVIEQQVDEELIAAYIQQHLPANEGKTCAQLQQEVSDMLDQGVFDFALLCILAQTEEIKAVRVFEGFARQVGLRFGQMAFEVADGLATALQQAIFNVHHQCVARPVMF